MKKTLLLAAMLAALVKMSCAQQIGAEQITLANTTQVSPTVRIWNNHLGVIYIIGYDAPRAVNNPGVAHGYDIYSLFDGQQAYDGFFGAENSLFPYPYNIWVDANDSLLIVSHGVWGGISIWYSDRQPGVDF